MVLAMPGCNRCLCSPTGSVARRHRFVRASCTASRCPGLGAGGCRCRRVHSRHASLRAVLRAPMHAPSIRPYAARERRPDIVSPGCDDVPASSWLLWSGSNMQLAMARDVRPRRYYGVCGAPHNIAHSSRLRSFRQARRLGRCSVLRRVSRAGLGVACAGDLDTPVE